jgi:hypothetical protein
MLEYTFVYDKKFKFPNNCRVIAFALFLVVRPTKMD